MLRNTALATLALLAISGSAYADDDRRARAFQPTGPQPIIEVLKAGGGTVTGTIDKVAANWFVLNDGRDEIDVLSRSFLPEGLQTGEQITVVGSIRRGALRAGQIIRADGTTFGRDVFQDRRRHHDDD